MESNSFFISMEWKQKQALLGKRRVSRFSGRASLASYLDVTRKFEDFATLGI
jgi:hypothetical protein